MTSSKAMNLGDFQHRVDLQESTETQSASGEPTQTWDTKYKAWAHIRQLNGRELFEAQAVNPGVTHQVKIRYRRNITNKWQVLFNDRELHIESIENVLEQNEWLVLMCKENV